MTAQHGGEQQPMGAGQWRALVAAHPRLVELAEPWLGAFTPHRPTPKQAAFLWLDCKEALFGGAAGGGKALKWDTPIATPDGWATMAGLAVGSTVFDERGQPTRVVAASEVMLGRPCYEVVFDDGSRVVADADHTWVVVIAADREARHQRDAACRAARRARRPSRGAGKRPGLAARHREHPTATLPPPTAQLVTTAQMAASVGVRSRSTVMVPVCEALALDNRALPVDPYVLGAWLGDGRPRDGRITSADPESRAECVGVLAHVPLSYLRASRGQRLALLQGLMDTDGTVNRRGAVAFTTTAPRLAEAVAELATSLGHKVAIREGPARRGGKGCGSTYRLMWAPSDQVFRLPRKRRLQAGQQRRAQRFRYVVAVRPVAPVPVRCIAVASPSGLFLAGRQMVPTHNSDALLMAALQYVHLPGYAALLLRRTYTDLALPGALMDRAAAWLRGTAARWSDRAKTWAFPSGATLSFGYLETEADKLRYQGAQFQFIGFDELTQFEESSYRYLFSRLRRTGGLAAPLRMRAASNPGGPGHEWVRRRFLDEGRATGRVFIPATLDDNPFLDQAAYRAALAELDPLTRAQLLLGDWEARPEGGLFRRATFPVVGQGPDDDAERVRYWDVAASEPAPGADPDWTVGLRLAARDGCYWVEDVRRTRARPAAVEALVRRTAEEDGPYLPIVMEQEPGSAGAIVIDHYARHVLPGFTFRGELSLGDKRLRASPVSSAAEQGRICLVRGPWLSAFLDELEAFPHGPHDDQVDAISGALAALREAAPPYALFPSAWGRRGASGEE